MSAVAEAIAEGKIGSCLWLYSNYHCNLACRHCFTESSPGAAPRLLGRERMIDLAREAVELGFEKIGVGGGEPFLLPEMPELLAALARYLPVIVLTNATLLKPPLLERLRPLAALPVTIQVSLDWADARENDLRRGRGGHDAVVSAVPLLHALGLKVRLATTGGAAEPAERKALCDLHLRLGIAEDEHVIRPTLRRGRAHDLEVAVQAGIHNLPPELTITADGAFWNPFAPAVQQGRVDTDLLISRTILPLSSPAGALLNLVCCRPTGGDAALEVH